SQNGPTSWAWTLTGGTPPTSIAQNPQVTYTTSGTKTITLIAANSVGSSAPVSKTVVVVDKPAISVNTPGAVCAGTEVLLTAAGATTYSWSPATGLNTITGATVEASPGSTTTYTVTGTTSGCSSSLPVTVTVLPLPAAPTITKAGDTLTSSYASNNQWYRDGTLLPGETGQTYIVTEAGDYTVSYTDGNSCTSFSAITTVTGVGIADHIAKDFSFEVSPNPSKGIFTIALNTRKTGDFRLEIRNVLGQLIAGKSLDKVSQQYAESIDLKSYGKGVYFISLENDEKVLTRKVLVD
ncbi:MAG TPA: T9SS type A sorting domain-containing protein, partial [Chitinophagaceae bacterium]|nr:T9SS type A sorting domain-containing protein [Chitinophagaceae bacterium]